MSALLDRINEFGTMPDTYLREIDSPDWDRHFQQSGGDPYSWVPDEIRDVWPQLNREGRLAVLVMAIDRASLSSR